MTKKFDKEELLNNIFKSFAEYNISNNKEYLIELIESLSSIDEICNSYAEITHVIYGLDSTTFNEIEDFFGLSKANNDFAGLRQEKELDKLEKDRKDNLNRFERHVRLSCFQREYINELTQKAENSAKKAKMSSEEALQHADIAKKLMLAIASSVKETGKFAEEAKKIAEKARKVSQQANQDAANVKKLTNHVQKKMTGIYSEFVGILAIFTALSFAMMGSVQMLGNLFNNISNPSSGSLGYALIIAGIYLIIIYLLIMTMVLSIKKIFGDITYDYKVNKLFVFIIFMISMLLIISGIVLILFVKVKI